MSETKFDAANKIWSGPKHQVIYNSNVGLGYLILSVLEKTPELITQVSADDNVEITCYEMRIRTMKMVLHLMKCGLKQGDVVGIMASNSENLAPVVFACFTLGLPVNPLTPVMTESDIIHMYSKTKPKIIFCDSNIVQTVQKSVDQMSIGARIFTLIEKVENYESADELILSNIDTSRFVFPELIDVANSAAFIICSSGTTGLPKGICKSHSQIVNQIYHYWNRKSHKQEVIFGFSTLYWLSGVLYLIIGTLYGGKRVITTKPFNPDLMIDILDRFQVNTCMSAPSAVVAILQSQKLKPFESLETFKIGGSIVSKSLCEAIKMYLPNGDAHSIYGMTEVDMTSGTFNSQRYGSVGQLAGNVKIKIIDEAENKLGPNEQGEICFKTLVLFLGYFNDLEKTRETVKDGWVHSGDIGYFDDDGFLFIVDRKKDLLKFNNYQVYPSELESIINQIHGVVDSCVVGVFEENKGNDLIYAFVVKDPTRSHLTEEFIKDYVESKVIDAKKLRGGVHFLSVFPMTPSGKIQRTVIKEIAQKMHL